MITVGKQAAAPLPPINTSLSVGMNTTEKTAMAAKAKSAGFKSTSAWARAKLAEALSK